MEGTVNVVINTADDRNDETQDATPGAEGEVNPDVEVEDASSDGANGGDSYDSDHSDDDEDDNDEGGENEDDEENENDEEDENENENDSDDDDDDDDFAKLVAAAIEEATEAQLNALAEVDLSKIPSHIATVLELLRKPYVPPPDEDTNAGQGDGEEGEEASAKVEDSDAVKFDRAITELKTLLSPFYSRNPLHPIPPFDSPPKDSSPSSHELITVINTHLIPAIPTFLSLIHPDLTSPYPDEKVNDSYRTDVISILCRLPFIPPSPSGIDTPTGSTPPDAPRPIIERHPVFQYLSRIIAHLRNGNVVDRMYITDMMENLMDVLEEDKSEEEEDDHEADERKDQEKGEKKDVLSDRDQVKEVIVKAIKEVLFLGLDGETKIGDGRDNNDEQEKQNNDNRRRDDKKQSNLNTSELVNVLGTLESVTLFTRTNCLELFLAAGAFDFLVKTQIIFRTPNPTTDSLPLFYHSSPPSSSIPKVLSATQSCLSAIYNAVKDNEELDELFMKASEVLKDEELKKTFGKARDFVVFTSFQVLELCQFPMNLPTSRNIDDKDDGKATNEGEEKDGGKEAKDEDDAYSAWETLVKTAAEFVNGTFQSSETPDVKLWLAASDGAVRALVMSLGRKDPSMYGIDAEWVLANLCHREDGEKDEDEDIEGGAGEESQGRSGDGDGEDGDGGRVGQKVGQICRDAVRDAFKALLFGEDEQARALELDEAIALVGGLQLSFAEIQRAAMRAGLPKFVTNVLTDKDGKEEAKLKLLEITDKIMENEQTAGYYFLKAGFIDCLVPLLSNASLLPSVLPLFSRLLSSYSPGETRRPLGPVVIEQLTSPNVYPILLALLNVSPMETSEECINAAGAVMRLLGNLVEDEMGTESWRYEDESGDPPPACPLKDVIITPELVRKAIALVAREPIIVTEEGLNGVQKQKPSPTSESALHFLGHACQGYKRGFDLVVDAFKERFATKSGKVDDEEVWLYHNLYGEFESSQSGRRKRKVAQAAVAADGLTRAYELMEREARKLDEGRESTEKDRKRRRAAVEGLRVLLCVDGVDVDVARSNKWLPQILVKLLEEETRMSMDVAFWMMWFLSKDRDFDADEDDDDSGKGAVTYEEKERVHAEKEQWIFDERWKGLGTSDVARHLVRILEHMPYDEEKNKPIEGSLSEEDYQKAEQRHNELLRRAAEYRTETTRHVVDLLNILVPLLGAHATTLVGRLLIRSKEISDNRRILLVINRILHTKGVSLTPAIDTINNFLDSPDPPSCSQFAEWITTGERLRDVILQSNAVDHFLKILATDKEEAEVYIDWSGALNTLGELASRTKDPTEKQKVQRRFVENTVAVSNALKILHGDDEWDAMQAVGAFGQLCDGFPAGLNMLGDSDEALTRVLKMFDTLDYSPELVAPLLGQLASAGPDKLTELLKGYFAALVAPPDQANAGKGSRKSKKKKKYTPRISQASLWERLELLAKTTEVARKAVVDSGAITESSKLLDSDSPEDWERPLETLASLVSADEGYQIEIARLLPRIKSLLPKDEAPCTKMLHLIKAFVLVDLPALISSGLVHTLLHASYDYPLCFDPPSALFKTIYDIASQPDGYPIVRDELKVMLNEEGIVEKEQDSGWRTGFAAALKKLSGFGEAGARVVIDAGGVEYAVKLLKNEHPQAIINGAKLSAFLAVSKTAPALSHLQKLGVVELAEVGRNKVIQYSQRPYSEDTSGDIDEDTYKYLCKCYADEDENMVKILTVLKGETGIYVEEED